MRERGRGRGREIDERFIEDRTIENFINVYILREREREMDRERGRKGEM